MTNLPAGLNHLSSIIATTNIPLNFDQSFNSTTPTATPTITLTSVDAATTQDDDDAEASGKSPRLFKSI